MLKFHVLNAMKLSPPQPAGLRTCAGALFGSLEKYASHFSNHAFGMTEPNNAPYTGTGENSGGELSYRSKGRFGLRFDVELLKLSLQ